jgi:hypothetical protein
MTYSYDAVGQVVQTQDSRGAAVSLITYAYYANGRLPR